MDAQSLFREGVLALRDRHDAARARQLLTQSLKLNPNNEMAWLWLSRTTDDPQKKLQCVERALKINPANEQALSLRAKLRPPSAAPTLDDLRAAIPDATEEPEAAEQAETVPPAPATPSAADQAQIAALLAEADERVKAEDIEGAIERWVRVLELQVDQPVAIQNAVRQLYKMGYKDDATELIQRAIDAGTTSIPIYLTAIDLARVRGDSADDLRERAALLPNADDALMLKMTDALIEGGQIMRADELLGKLIAQHPDNQALLVRMGELQEKLGNKTQAVMYYERGARLKSGSKAGKSAEKVLSGYTPVITDRERGSVLLALREAVGFGAVYLLMGWQDAGLNLLRLGAARWLGVGLSIIGGYLLVTALSAPQQTPLAGWLGGQVPPPKAPSPKPQNPYDETPSAVGPIEEPTNLPILPDTVRAVFALVGVIVLIGAFVLVFSTAIQLLRHPAPTYVPSIQDLLSE